MDLFGSPPPSPRNNETRSLQNQSRETVSSTSGHREQNAPPPKADNLTLQTVGRNLSAPAGQDMARYGANHFNDTVKGLLHFIACALSGGLAFLLDKMKFDGENIRLKEQQLDDVNELIYDTMCELDDINSDEQIRFQLSIDGKSIQFVIEKDSQSGLLVLRSGSEVEYLEGLTSYQQLKDKLELETVCKPRRLVKELLKFNTLEVAVHRTDDNRAQPEINQHKVPGHDCDNFVSILAGITHSSRENPKRDLSASATTVMHETATHEKMFAGTVVAGNKKTSIPYNSQVYSALITAAALHTVGYGIRKLGLNGDALQEFFCRTLKGLDKDNYFGNAFVDDPNGRGVKFGGVVCYLDKKLQPQQFVYGCGDVAVAETTPLEINLDRDASKFEGTETLHLQGKMGSRATPSLTPESKVDDLLRFVTAKVSEIDQSSVMHIMTSGCSHAFFEPIANNGAIGKPDELRCINLPVDGNLDPHVLLRETSDKKSEIVLEAEKENPEDLSIIQSNMVSHDEKNIYRTKAGLMRQLKEAEKDLNDFHDDSIRNITRLSGLGPEAFVDKKMMEGKEGPLINEAAERLIDAINQNTIKDINNLLKRESIQVSPQEWVNKKVETSTVTEILLSAGSKFTGEDSWAFRQAEKKIVAGNRKICEVNLWTENTRKELYLIEYKNQYKTLGGSEVSHLEATQVELENKVWLLKQKLEFLDGQASNEALYLSVNVRKVFSVLGKDIIASKKYEAEKESIDISTHNVDYGSMNENNDVI